MMNSLLAFVSGLRAGPNVIILPFQSKSELHDELLSSCLFLGAPTGALYMLIADLQIGPQRHFFNKQKSVTYELTDMFPRTPNYMLKLAFICSTTIYDCITMRHKQIAQRQDTDNTWLHRSSI